MKVLHVCWLGTIGGLERYTLQLTENLKAKGHLVDVCILHRTGPISDESKGKGIRTYFIGMKSGFDIRGALRLKSFLQNSSYDIIHVHDRNFLANFILKIFCKSPKIFTEHGGELIGNKPWKRLLFYKLLSSQYKKIIANSNYISNLLIKYNLANKERVITIYNGIDVEELLSPIIDKNKEKKALKISEDSKIIGIIGRLVPTKGIDLFVQTAEELAQINNNFTFLIVGDGPNRKEYEEMTRRIKTKVDIRFIGWQKDIERILPIFDIFLFTSRGESFGIVLLEAMASGVPIVGFDIPGANEVVEKNVSAILVKPYDISKLVDAVLDVNSNSMLYNTLSNNGRSRAKNNFSIETNVNKVLQIYHFIHKQL